MTKVLCHIPTNHFFEKQLKNFPTYTPRSKVLDHVIFVILIGVILPIITRDLMHTNESIFFSCIATNFLYSNVIFFKMPKTRELSEFDRGEIIGLWKGGHVERDIVNILDYPKSTIHNIIEKYKTEHQISNAPRSGRPPKLTERNVRYLVKTVKKDR